MIRAVTFDYWNTLMYEQAGAARNRRIDAWLGILEGVGFKVERERLDEIARERSLSWQQYVAQTPLSRIGTRSQARYIARGSFTRTGNRLLVQALAHVATLTGRGGTE